MAKNFGNPTFSIQFLVVVTYLVSASLILSSIFYQVLVSYVADRIFEHKYKMILPALFTSALVLMIISAVLGTIAVMLLLSDQPLVIKILMVSNFVVLNIIWLYTNTLSGLKNYHFILIGYILCYLGIFILVINLFQYELIGMLLAFYIGHVCLLASFVFFTVRHYPMQQFIRWDIFYFMRNHKLLVLGGLFFQMGVWVDKYCFWINPETSVAIIGGLHASPIYDMPMFLAFVLLIPAISIFFYDIEVNFTRYYEVYYDAIRNGGTLDEINDKRIELVAMARTCFLNAFKLQVFVTIICSIFAPEIVNKLGLSLIYLYLLRIDLLASCFFIAFIAQICFLYHLKKQFEIAWITFIFFITSLILTLITFKLGPWYYGYGFVVSLFIANLCAFYWLNKGFKKLNYYSFMSIDREY